MCHFLRRRTPLDEQRRILDATREEFRPLDFAMSNYRREISLLQEYRTRLIADVVTGKLDVSGVVASLPKETDVLDALDDADAVVEGDEEIAEGDIDIAPVEVEA